MIFGTNIMNINLLPLSFFKTAESRQDKNTMQLRPEIGWMVKERKK